MIDFLRDAARARAHPAADIVPPDLFLFRRFYCVLGTYNEIVTAVKRFYWLTFGVCGHKIDS